MTQVRRITQYSKLGFDRPLIHGFSTFHMGQLAKIHRHRWKERLKISKAAKFESNRIKTNEDMAPQSRRIL